MNPSTALATVLLRSLAEHGVRHVVVCPGSRSAPLAYAAVAAAEAGDLRLHVRIDERAAGFLALGLAKATGQPVAVVTTSGTAVAHLHPAVLEAAHAGVPLLVLSADRPHELRGTGANQTTDQVKLFGTAVRTFAELPAPERRRGQVAAWRAVAARAVAAARGTLTRLPGPVHVNVAFREPLVPDDDPAAADWPEPLDAGAATSVSPVRAAEPVSLDPGPRTVVLAGDGAGWTAAWLAEAGGWPLLAEPSSGARCGPNAVGPYRLLLGLPDLGGRIERVVVHGRPTLSRPVSALLARADVEVVVVTERADWPDPAGNADRVVPGAVPAHLTDAVKGWYRAGPDAWLSAWRAAGAAAVAALDELLDAEAADGRLTGPFVAREVAAALGPAEALVCAASSPIRDLDLAGAPFDEDTVLRGGRGIVSDDLRAVLANRGLAGIDGTLSTAAGVALGRDRGTVRCLVGDLAFLHDLNGLLIGPAEDRPDVQIVLADDDGGAIFAGLEHGERALRGPAEASAFERVFGTPHGADVAALCTGYGAAYRPVGNADDLRKALASPPRGISVVHVRIDRRDRRALDARIRDAVSAAAAAALGG